MWLPWKTPVLFLFGGAWYKNLSSPIPTDEALLCLIYYGQFLLSWLRPPHCKKTKKVKACLTKLEESKRPPNLVFFKHNHKDSNLHHLYDYDIKFIGLLAANLSYQCTNSSKRTWANWSYKRGGDLASLSSIKILHYYLDRLKIKTKWSRTKIK